MTTKDFDIRKNAILSRIQQIDKLNKTDEEQYFPLSFEYLFSKDISEDEQLVLVGTPIPGYTISDIDRMILIEDSGVLIIRIEKDSDHYIEIYRNIEAIHVSECYGFDCKNGYLKHGLSVKELVGFLDDLKIENNLDKYDSDDRILKEFDWLKDVSISDNTILKLYYSNKSSLISSLQDNYKCCIKIIEYLKSLGFDEMVVEELLLYQTHLFLMNPNKIATLLKAASLRKFIEDIPECWDTYICDIFDNLEGYGKPYLGFIENVKTPL